MLLLKTINAVLPQCLGITQRNLRSKANIRSKYRDEISHLQSAWHSAREEAMTLRNSFEKRSALEREIKTLTEANAQLEKDIASASETLDPLEARRAELTR